MDPLELRLRLVDDDVLDRDVEPGGGLPETPRAELHLLVEREVEPLHDAACYRPFLPVEVVQADLLAGAFL